MKKLIILTVLVLSINCIHCGGEVEDVSPSLPIFSDAELIVLTSPSDPNGIVDRSNGDRFLFEAPSSVQYFILGVMAVTKTPVVSGKTITNPGDFVCGLVSGQSGFSNGNVRADSLRVYNPVTKDFTGALYSGTCIDCNWFVIGYDQWGNLTHASPAWQVDIVP